MADTAQLLPRGADELLSANRWKSTAPPGRPSPRRAGHRPAPGPATPASSWSPG